MGENPVDAGGSLFGAGVESQMLADSDGQRPLPTRDQTVDEDGQRQRLQSEKPRRLLCSLVDKNNEKKPTERR